MSIETFVSNRLDSFYKIREMWGSDEAREAMAIQLLEVEYYLRSENVYKQNPRIVLDLYITELQKAFPGKTPLYLKSSGDEFAKALLEICSKVREKLKAL